MYATDFVYDGEHLSDYGCIICTFDAASGVNAVARGSELTFNTVPINDGYTHRLTSAKYDNCIEISIDICKDPDVCGYDYYDRIISEHEHEKIVRWLNRKQFLPLNFKNDYDRVCYFDASFNIENIYINDILYGFRLSIHTNKPFGYGDEVKETIHNEQSDTSFVVENESDEIGYTFPQLKISFDQVAGDLTVVNETYLSNFPMVIKGCSLGEVITIDCENQIISSTKKEHDICGDFNFRFFRLGNSYRTGENKIRISLPCTIEMTYKPIIKNIN